MRGLSLPAMGNIIANNRMLTNWDRIGQKYVNMEKKYGGGKVLDLRKLEDYDQVCSIIHVSLFIS